MSVELSDRILHEAFDVERVFRDAMNRDFARVMAMGESECAPDNRGEAARLSGASDVVPLWLKDVEAATERLQPAGPNPYRELRLKLEQLARVRTVSLSHYRGLSALYATSQQILNQPHGQVPPQVMIHFISDFAAWARSL